MILTVLASDYETSSTPPPDNLQLTGLTLTPGQHHIAAAWDATPGATGYNIVYYDQADQIIHQETTTGTSYDIVGLVAGHTYGVSVAPYSPGHASSGQFSQATVPPEQSNGLTQTAGPNHGVILSSPDLVQSTNGAQYGGVFLSAPGLTQTTGPHGGVILEED